MNEPKPLPRRLFDGAEREAYEAGYLQAIEDFKDYIAFIRWNMDQGLNEIELANEGYWRLTMRIYATLRDKVINER